MIPFIDIYLKELLERKLQFLQSHPDILEQIFRNPGTNANLKSFKEFVLRRKIHVMIGFPMEEQKLPCYVITIAGEQEMPLGVGDNIDDFEEDWDEKDITTQYALNSIAMQGNYRIECWSDNGDLTACLYTLLKWCLLAGRSEMIEKGLYEPQLTGTDLEPVPDYYTLFIFRRSVILSIRYEMTYFNSEKMRGEGEREIPLNATIENVHLISKPYKKEAKR